MIIRQRGAGEHDRVLAIWRRAVDATHGFLSPEDRRAIEAQLGEFLPQTPMWVAECDGEVQGFMVLHGGMIEALFIDPDRHGSGVGSALIAHALDLAPHAKVDANEQADNAVPFYEARGFQRIGRSDHDDQGRPYPIIHFRHPGRE